MSRRNRPDPSQRFIKDRTAPVRIQVRTEWNYSTDERYCPCCPGPHAFGRSGNVTASDVPSQYEHQQSPADHLERAISAFGDDADLIIEVRRADPQP